MPCAQRRPPFADPTTDERFIYTLCRELGCTPDELDERVSMEQFVKFKALYMVERAERKHMAEKARQGI